MSLSSSLAVCLFVSQLWSSKTTVTFWSWVEIAERGLEIVESDFRIEIQGCGQRKEKFFSV